MTQSVQGVIINYRTGPRTQTSKEYLIQFAHARSVSEAARLVGRKVAWQKGNYKVIGRIFGLHGKKGVVRARLRRGLPGQAIGTTIQLIG